MSAKHKYDGQKPEQVETYHSRLCPDCSAFLVYQLHLHNMTSLT
jgi:hypothetical protein